MSDELCPGCPGDPNENCCKPELRVKVWMDKQKADMADQKTEQKTLQDELLDEVKRQLQTIDELVAMSLGVSVARLQASCNLKPGGERAYTVDLIARAEAARTKEPRHG